MNEFEIEGHQGVYKLYRNSEFALIMGDAYYRLKAGNDITSILAEKPQGDAILGKWNFSFSAVSWFVPISMRDVEKNIAEKLRNDAYFQARVDKWQRNLAGGGKWSGRYS